MHALIIRLWVLSVPARIDSPDNSSLAPTLIKKAAKVESWYIMSCEIEKIHAREILDSRGNPTVYPFLIRSGSIETCMTNHQRIVSFIWL